MRGSQSCICCAKWTRTEPVLLEHRRTGERVLRVLCDECQSNSDRAVWLAWRRADDDGREQR
ncbi:MAG: hypothetical protein ACYDHT_06620 [Solirubrobacteraceae bacterium]